MPATGPRRSSRRSLCTTAGYGVASTLVRCAAPSRCWGWQSKPEQTLRYQAIRPGPPRCLGEGRVQPARWRVQATICPYRFSSLRPGDRRVSDPTGGQATLGRPSLVSQLTVDAPQIGLGPLAHHLAALHLHDSHVVPSHPLPGRRDAQKLAHMGGFYVLPYGDSVR